MSDKKNILIIDDDDSFAASISAVLETVGYQIRRAQHGEEGLKMAREDKPDLILLDVMMRHETEGLSVSREIRTIPELSGVKILMVTGIRSEMNMFHGIEPDPDWLPVDHLLEKPVAPEQLLAEVSRLLG